jgi:gamma-glutamylcyclotransferase (GGCT)/AIG2-like uncharacterized protein YtfP
MKNYYFAYGSNLDKNQMNARCPEHEVVQTVCLPNYELCFPRFSKGNRQCGVASVMENEKSTVWGILYKLSKTDFENLDLHENIPHSYVKTTIKVFSPCMKNSFEAVTYLANPQQGNFKPSREYLDLILNGLKTCEEVPDHYLIRLASIDIL